GVAELDESGERILRTFAPGRVMTIQDLMRHTCGMPYGGSGSTAVHRQYPNGSISAAAAMEGNELLHRLSLGPLLEAPVRVWDYGFGLDVLGLIVEKVSGQTLGQFLDTRLFRPLAMSDTGFHVPAGNAARYAKALPNDPLTGDPQSLPDLTCPMQFECGGG